MFSCETLNRQRFSAPTNCLAENFPGPISISFFQPRSANARKPGPRHLGAVAQFFGNLLGEGMERSGDEKDSVPLRDVPGDSQQPLGKKLEERPFREEVFDAGGTHTSPVQLVAVHGVEESFSARDLSAKGCVRQESCSPWAQRKRTPLAAFAEEAQQSPFEGRFGQQRSIEIEKRSRP